MRTIVLTILMLFLVSSNFTEAKQKDGKVYVCTGSRSQCYHKVENCRGLKSCRGEVKKISLKAAQSVGRRECKICYKK